MSKQPQKLLLYLSLLFFLNKFHPCFGDVGTASHYSQPYVPTACFGRDNSQFPPSNIFGAAGEGIWDNGAACGRQYIVKCISSVVKGACVEGQEIQVRIVDRAQTAPSRPAKDGTTIVLSDQAYGRIVTRAVDFVNIEYQEI